MIKAKPFIKWAGSKKLVIPKLVDIVGGLEFDTYIEPFAGSAQFYFHLNPLKSILSDTNKDLIATYKLIKNKPEVLHAIIDKYEGITETDYYELRTIYNSCKEKELKSALFIILNKHCFNGLYRINQKGEFNVPFGYKVNRKLPSLEELSACSIKLKKTKLICGDFENIVKSNLKGKCLVYLDPPYAIENKNIFNQYNSTTFGKNDLKRLKSLLKFIDRSKNYFVMSYSYSNELVKEFSAWNQKKIFVKRNIAGFAEYRKKAAELLITNIDY